MSQPQVFVEAPKDLFEIIAGKLGKFPLLLIDDDMFKEIKLVSAKYGKIPSLFGYFDAVVCRLSFTTIMNTEYIPENISPNRSFELDVFLDETFDPCDSSYMIDSNVSSGEFDYKNGFDFEAKGKEALYINSLKETLIELEFFTTFSNKQIINAWNDVYARYKEEKWTKDFSPYVLGAKKFTYVDENKVKITLKDNNFNLFNNPSSIYHQINIHKNEN